MRENTGWICVDNNWWIQSNQFVKVHGLIKLKETIDMFDKDAQNTGWVCVDSN